MRTNNILKALAFALLLTTACNKMEVSLNKGYELPVTINVTRQGENPATRATFNDGTKKLEFSSGDKLLVLGEETTAGQFSGTLDYDAVSGKFSGTILTQNAYSGTADELLTAASDTYANLLPNGYDTYGFLSINNEGTYSAYVSSDYHYAFATSKAAAVEQFSYESSYSYSNGFALTPESAILNFTITGLTASTEVAVAFSGECSASGTVTTDGSGTATFAVGVMGDYTDLNGISLTVGGNAITLVNSSKTLAAGKIYNINRSAAPALTYPIALGAVTSDYVGSVVTTDGNVYATVGDATAATKTAAAMIAYVSSTGHGLALALADEGEMGWTAAGTTCSGKTPTVTGGTWKLATKDEWDNMISGAGGYATLRDGFESVGGTNMQSYLYWSSTSYSSYYAWLYDIGNGAWNQDIKSLDFNVRACLAF